MLLYENLDQISDWSTAEFKHIDVWIQYLHWCYHTGECSATFRVANLMYLLKHWLGYNSCVLLSYETYPNECAMVFSLELLGLWFSLKIWLISYQPPSGGVGCQPTCDVSLALWCRFVLVPISLYLFLNLWKTLCCSKKKIITSFSFLMSELLKYLSSFFIFCFWVLIVNSCFFFPTIHRNSHSKALPETQPRHMQRQAW